MSMLAERKRKQKWSLNPRGKVWSQDNSKFGQRLLEKMGWSQGKGLGAKENGITEHIKVSYKNDSQGMGYKESDDQWTEHESNFTELLAALGGGDDKTREIKLTSLEEKSQKSKARVHYRKFTRGKDLSKYSEKDLANIFGKKSLKENKKVKVESEAIEQEKNSVAVEDKNFSDGGLMSDYFKKKLSHFGSTNGYVIGNNGVLKKCISDEENDQTRSFSELGFNQNDNADKGYESQSEVDARPSFGFGFKANENKDSKIISSFVSYLADTNETTLKKRKKKRTIDEPIVTEDTPSKKKKLEANVEETPTKKKKDKSKKKSFEDAGLANPGFDPMYTPVKLEKHILEPIEESVDGSLADQLNDTVGQVAETFEVQVQINNEVSPMKREELESSCGSRKKKKKKDKIESTNPFHQNEDLDLTLNTNQSVMEISEAPKKKKKKSKIAEESIEPVDTTCLNDRMDTSSLSELSIKSEKKKKAKSKTDSVESIPAVSDNHEEQSVGSKKKMSKSKGSQEGIDNPFFNLSIENETSEEVKNPFEVKLKEKKKKSKKNKNLGLENPVFSQEDSTNSQDIANEAFEVKRKDKSKKKKKLEENKGLDNPALNLNDTIESCDLMLNIVSTPIQMTNTNANKVEKSGNIQKMKVVERRKSVRFSDVTRERIIPNKEDIHNETLDDSRDIVEVEGKLNDSADMSYVHKILQKRKAKKKNKGLVNDAFDEKANIVEEQITSITNTLDDYQAEVENDMNEEKLKSVEIDDIMVGEVGNPDGTNEILSDGSVKLKFKYANFKKTSKYFENLTGAKKSYKHLIKGDIVMKFKESNLHEINGYAVTRTS